jgi:hypothetical protein
VGTFIAVDAPTAAARDAYINALKQIGIHAGVCTLLFFFLIVVLLLMLFCC